MKWRWWRTADEKAADFAKDRERQTDEQFFSECGLPDTAQTVRIALAVRRSVASVGAVEPEYIRTNDRYPEELAALSGWDSLDFLDWVFQLERELGNEVHPTKAYFA